jgi:DNA-binding transcriptional MerR regulator
MSDHQLVQIGTFSRLSRTSVRMLRHYAEHGLLVPAYVDPASGYRYYHPEQLREAERVLSLRDAGFSVAQMPAALRAFDDAESLRHLLAAQRRHLIEEQDRAQDRLAALDRLIHTTEEPDMSITIRHATLPAMTVATMRDVLPSYAHEQQLWDQLMPTLPPGSYATDAPCGATYPDEEYRDSDVEVEIWVQLTEPVAADLPHRHIDEQTIVATTVHGDYSQFTQVCQELGRYVTEHSLKTGPIFNIYRVSPAQDPNPDNWVTDVCLPIID